MDKYKMRENAPELLYAKYCESPSRQSFREWVVAEILKPTFPGWLFPHYDQFDAADRWTDPLVDDLYDIFFEQLDDFIQKNVGNQ